MILEPENQPSETLRRSLAIHLSFWSPIYAVFDRSSQACAISSRVANQTSGYWLEWSMKRRSDRTRPARPTIRG